VNKPESGHFAKAGVTPRRVTVELRTDDATEYTLGQEITAELFEAGQRSTSAPPARARASPAS
jgi:large subunit ribosomal protein L3